MDNLKFDRAGDRNWICDAFATSRQNSFSYTLVHNTAKGIIVRSETCGYNCYNLSPYYGNGSWNKTEATHRPCCISLCRCGLPHSHTVAVIHSVARNGRKHTMYVHNRRSCNTAHCCIQHRAP